MTMYRQGKMEQLSLPVSVIDARFQEFHKNNPVVYGTLVGLVRKAVDSGKNRIGIKMLWEVLRWELWIKTNGTELDFKLNNNYTSRYARLIMKNEPELKGIFELRGLRT